MRFLSDRNGASGRPRPTGIRTHGSRAAQCAAPTDAISIRRRGQAPALRYSSNDACSLNALLIRLAFGHFPLEGERLAGGHMGPPLRRDYKPSGTGGSGTRPYGVIRTGHVGSAESGAVVEPQQLQFLQTQALVGREESRTATPFLRAGNSIPSQRGNPRNGVRGRLPLSGGDGPKGQRG